MIEVPARVKDALKSGDYRKNVKITVPGVDMREVVTDVVSGDDLPLFTGMSSMIFDDHHQLIGWDIEFWNDSSFTIDESYSKIRIYADVPFDYLTFNGTRYDAEGDKTYAIIPTPATGEYAAYSLRVYYTSNDPDYNPNIQPRRFDCYGYIDWFDNDNLVSESVKFDERMCSDTELKFGLCEGTSVEFQYFDLPNIRGEEISIEIEVEYKDENSDLAWYSIPMGWFEVKECSRQASTGIIKAIAYNKLHSEYLDQNVLPDILNYVGYGQSKSISDILNYLLNGYHIEKTDWEEVQCVFSPKSIGVDEFWHGISVSDDHGQTWSNYTVSPTLSPSPYGTGNAVPSGTRWVVYTAKFYYVPVDDDPQTTTHHYKYEGVDLPNIWKVACPSIGFNNLEYLYDYDPDYPYHDPETGTVTMGSPVIMQISGQGVMNRIYGTANQTFMEYATGSGIKPQGDDISGYVGVLGTSVYGYTEPVNIGEFTGSYPVIEIPLAIVVQDDGYIGMYPPNPYPNTKIWKKVQERYNEVCQALTAITLPKMYRKILSPMEEETLSYSQLESMNQITLRDLQSAVFEVDCQYGKLDRVTDLFAGIELNDGSLYPRDDLYPDDTLFPNGQAEAGYPAMYSKLWADEGNVRTFRNLIITYKGTDNGQEVEKKIQRTVNANGTDDYNMSDNWLFKNIVWSDADVAAYADAMVAKMRNISWFPFEMWCVGLPNLEAGDAIEIAMQQGTYKSYVLRRNLNGIQNLQDEMIDGTLDIF